MVTVVPKSVSWSAMLSDVDPVPEVRTNRTDTGIAKGGMPPPAEAAPSAALASASTGAGGVGGRDDSSSGVTMAT